MATIDEKIQVLLRQGAEYEKLDYKRKLDIDDTRSIVEISKDIAAMLSSGGGSLLIGANDKGKATSDLTDDLAARFDEATLRNKLKKYISEPIPVVATVAKMDGFNFILIECEEYGDGFVVLKSDGQYPHNGKTKGVFRKGDVFVRHGSASERWEQHDISRIINSQISKRKIEWLKDAELILSRINQSIPEAGKEKERLREVTNPLKQKISDNSLNISDLRVAIDEISLTAIMAIQSDKDESFYAAIEALRSCYGLGFDVKGNWRLNGSFNPVDLWYEILVRLPLIGGACIEAKKYGLAKSLVLQKVPGDDGRHFPNWYRHAFTMSSRSNRLPRGGDGEKRSFLMATTDIFRNDAQYKSALNWEVEEGITYIVRFDYLSALVALDDIQKISTSAFYTSFANYDKDRIQQMLVELVLDDKNRATLFKSSPENLAHIIQEVDTIAERESDDFWWDAGEWSYGLDEFMLQAKPFSESGAVPA